MTENRDNMKEMKSVNVIVGLGILAKEKEQRCHLEGNVMQRRGRVRLLTVCIMFGVISIFGCGEAKRTHKMNDAKTEESSGQADDAETEESSDKPYNKDDRGSIDRKDNACYANNRGNRITYEDGYCYYYASQTDNYFLYRAREDGKWFWLGGKDSLKRDNVLYVLVKEAED